MSAPTELGDSTVADASFGVALSDLRRVTEVGLERLSSQVGLAVQRLDQSDERARQEQARWEKMEKRVETLEETGVTKLDLAARQKETDRRFNKTLAVIGTVTTLLLILIPVLNTALRIWVMGKA